MTRNVGIQIQKNESMLAAMENEVDFVVLDVARDAAKDALVRL
jgi:hypothetical protein